MQRGTNKIPKCFSCPIDCKELSKKTKRSTYDSNQARTKSWPTRPPTSNNNSPITKQLRTNETPKCFSSLGDFSGLSKEARRWNSRNQGSIQLTVAYTRASVGLPHESRIQKQTKKKIPARYQQLFTTSGEGRKGTDQSKHSQHFQGPSSTMMWVWLIN